ncbi:hypothetical protein [Terribacillus saccharophilus]|uniref:Ribbon-helix-helix domain-containing protein n=1 Tax=Terribacillus saccharophilus TaxID=361277 RepID=A0ABX4GTD8_9BACI|nr:hypothetical protein [Terribacillus saccharophilus]PAD94375.1 hypothetical protein CHH50_18825 [Terribacillus saccharophilus]PAD98123.1 hypothetical protein CHH48_18940 [Terribacillus saccharophilus]
MSKRQVEFSEATQKKLDTMAEETGITRIALIKMAVESLVANYEVKGGFIFADLLNPDHRFKK